MTRGQHTPTGVLVALTSTVIALTFYPTCWSMTILRSLDWLGATPRCLKRKRRRSYASLGRSSRHVERQVVREPTPAVTTTSLSSHTEDPDFGEPERRCTRNAGPAASLITVICFWANLQSLNRGKGSFSHFVICKISAKLYHPQENPGENVKYLYHSN